jgi:hypothetical protein
MVTILPRGHLTDRSYGCTATPIHLLDKCYLGEQDQYILQGHLKQGPHVPPQCPSHSVATPLLKHNARYY